MATPLCSYSRSCVRRTSSVPNSCVHMPRLQGKTDWSLWLGLEEPHGLKPLKFCLKQPALLLCATLGVGTAQ